MPVSQAISSPRLLPSNLNELITTPNIFRNMAHIDDDEIPLNRLGQSHMPKTAAAVAFAKTLIETRGRSPKPICTPCAKLVSATRTLSKSPRSPRNSC